MFTPGVGMTFGYLQAKLLRSQQDLEGEFSVTEFCRGVAPLGLKAEDSISDAHLINKRYIETKWMFNYIAHPSENLVDAKHYRC